MKRSELTLRKVSPRHVISTTDNDRCSVCPPSPGEETILRRERIFRAPESVSTIMNKVSLHYFIGLVSSIL
jgi:hypothetical protein